MRTIAEHIERFRKPLLVLWGIFALWVFSQYQYRFAHETPWTIDVAINYAVGFSRSMILPWLIALFIALLAYITGRMVIRKATKGKPFMDDLEETVFALAIGLGVISIMSFLYVFGNVGFAVLAILAVLVLVFGFRDCIHLGGVMRKAFAPTKWDLLDTFLFVLIAALLLSTMFLPNNLPAAGSTRVTFVASATYWVDLWRNSTASRFGDPLACLMYLLMILSAVVVYMLGRRLESGRAGLIAAVLFLLARHLQIPVAIPYSEYALCFTILLALYALFAWRRTGTGAWRVLAVLFLAAILWRGFVDRSLVPLVWNPPASSLSILRNIWLPALWSLVSLLIAWVLHGAFRLDKFNPRNRVHLAWMFLAITLAFGLYYRCAIYPATGTNLVFTDEAIDAAIRQTPAENPDNH
jgi:hypothetical protein